MVRRLEQLWSRFLPWSEVSALNALDGRLGIVSHETFELIACADQARDATNGAFNPLMLEQLEFVGYDRSWEAIEDSDTPLGEPQAVCTEPIELFPAVRGVRLPTGARFDPGGIGKGLAGDLVARRLTELGAATTQIELGGDVRLSGREWSGGDWTVNVDDREHGAESAASIAIPEGGVATSSSVRRSWRRGNEQLHHLLDSATGLPALTDLAAATVVAPTLWWAEVMAKVAVVAGHRGAREQLEQLEMTGVLVGKHPHERYDVVAPRSAAA